MKNLSPLKYPAASKKHPLDSPYKWEDALAHISCAILEESESAGTKNFQGLLMDAGMAKHNIETFVSINEFLDQKTLNIEIIFLLANHTNVFSLLKIAQQKLPAVPVILVAPYMEAVEVDKLCKEGVSDYLAQEKLSLRELRKSLFFVLKNQVNNDQNFGVTEITKEHSSLQVSEQRFKALVQDGSDLIGILDLEGNYTYVSPTSASVVGLEPEFLLGKNAFDFIHPDDTDFLKSEFSKIADIKRLRFPPFRFKDGRGKWQWIETIATNLLEDPSIDGIVVNSRVVTHSIELEHHLCTTLGKLKNIMDASLDMICTFDGEGRIASVSRASETILGYKPEEMEGRKYEEFLLPEDRELTFVASENVKAGKRLTNLQNRYIAKDGKIVPLMWSAQYNEELDKIICVARDVTERQKADETIRSINEELRLSNERYLYSLKATNETIWAYDIGTEELSWSDSIERNFGYRPENNREHVSVWLNRIHEKDRPRVENSFQQAKNAKDNFWCEEYEFIKNNGEISHVLDRGYLIRNSKGEAIKIVGAMLDMTEMRKKSLEVEEKNRELSEICWIQSHIVRAPIARILGLIDVLRISGEEKAKKEALEYLLASASELDEITRKIIQKTEQGVKNEL